MIILIYQLLCSSHCFALYVGVLCEIHVVKMNTYCGDNADGVDLKGGIQGGAHRTAVYLGERCRYDHPSGPVDTPPERESREIY